KKSRLQNDHGKLRLILRVTPRRSRAHARVQKKGRSRARRGRQKRHAKRSLAAGALVAADTGNEIIARRAAKAAGGAGDDVAEVAGVSAVGVNGGKFGCRTDGEAPCKIYDASQGRRGHAGAAKNEPAA